ncbi:hypothetical protein NPIL_515481 [Nephila pilipes]|uniref:Uncharacterized protein n=1 Tax=Nephila pilipes TaxID=299642 RepID=A0A8X6R5U9_NEPPI|nr:hypothetical protein NPIL_515481 [Nephila pilipes]
MLRNTMYMMSSTTSGKHFHSGIAMRFRSSRFILPLREVYSPSDQSSSKTQILYWLQSETYRMFNMKREDEALRSSLNVGISS